MFFFYFLFWYYLVCMSLKFFIIIKIILKYIKYSIKYDEWYGKGGFCGGINNERYSKIFEFNMVNRFF